MVSSKSKWAYLQYTPLLSKVKILRDLAKRIDETVQSASSANQTATDKNLNELPDLEIISSKHISTRGFIPVKFRLIWPELLTSIMDACISEALSLEKCKKTLQLANVFYARLIVGVRSTSRSKRKFLSRLNGGNQVIMLHCGTRRPQ